MNNVFLILSLLCLFLCTLSCKKEHTKTNDYEKEISNIAGLLFQTYFYFLKTGKAPECLENIDDYLQQKICIGHFEIQDLNIIDHWGTALLLERCGDSIEIRSAGQDHVFQTDDDLVGSIILKTNTILTVSYNVEDQIGHFTLCID